LPNFSEEELTPNVLQLLEVSHYQRELIQALRDEVAQRIYDNKDELLLVLKRPGVLDQLSNLMQETVATSTY